MVTSAITPIDLLWSDIERTNSSSLRFECVYLANELG